MLKTGQIRWTLALSALFLAIVTSSMGWFSPRTALAARESGRNACSNGHRIPSFGGTVIVDVHQVMCGDLTAFGGTVVINGEVQGDTVTFGTDLVIAGTVDGNVDLYGGSVTLQSGSHVHGDINIYGGDWTQGNGAQLDGTVIYHTRHVGWLFFNSGDFSFPFWPIIVWGVLGLLLTTALPERVTFVRTTVMSKPRRSLLLGVLSALLTLPVMIVLLALILTIPLAIIVALGLIAAWALGTIAIGWMIGEYVVRKVAPHYNTRPVQVVVGLTVLVLAGSLPYIGDWISIGTGLLGLGAVFLSRFGTRLYSPPKEPLSL